MFCRFAAVVLMPLLVPLALPSTLPPLGAGVGGVDGEYVIDLVVTPANATLFAGGVQQFTALATVLVGNGTETRDVTRKVKWTSTIGEIDDRGLFRAHEAGVGIVKAIYGAVHAEAEVVVEHGPVHATEITVENRTVIGRAA